MIDWVEIWREKRDLKTGSELTIHINPCEFGLQLSMALGQAADSHIFPQTQLDVYRLPTMPIIREMRAMAKRVKQERGFHKHTDLKPGEF